MQQHEQTQLAAELQTKRQAMAASTAEQSRDLVLDGDAGNGTDRAGRNFWADRLLASQLARSGYPVFPYELIVTSEEASEADDA